MKLLSINLARSIWLGQLIDLNPRGINLDPLLIPLLIKRYKFKKFPLPGEILDNKKGIKFEEGEFKTKKDESISILAFTIYSDGFMVDSRSSTKDSEDFLEEILTAAREEFNLTPYEEVVKKKNYLSQMFVSTDKSLTLSLNPKLEKISEYLSRNIIGFENASFELGGISFWPDQKLPTNPAPFTLERQLGAPFSVKRYFSSAPLTTEKHWDLLNTLENIMEG